MLPNKEGDTAVKRALFPLSVFILVLASGTALADPHRFGGGIRYNRSVTSLGDDFDKSGVSLLLSYQYAAPILVRFEGDLEIIPSSVTGNGTAVVPWAYALVGGLFYGGIGAGIAYADGEFANDPIFALRIGLDVGLGPVHADVNANYQFVDFDQLGDLDANYVTLGLMARYEF